jgi:hypothetical protein
VAQFDRAIPPGGEGKITLEIRTKGYQGDMHKAARVMSNDPKNPQLTITMKGKIWAPIQINPRHVHLRGAVGDKLEQVVRVQGEKEEPLMVKLASVSIPDKLGVELRETEKGRGYEVKIQNKVAGEATYAGQVKLTTNYPEKPELVIRVSVNVRGPVEVRPKALNFGRMSEERLEQLKTNNRFLRRPVTVVLNTGDDLNVSKVELEKSLFKAVPKPVQRGRLVQIVVEPILEKLQKGLNQDRLKIYTNQKDSEVLEVPIRFEILQMSK